MKSRRDVVKQFNKWYDPEFRTHKRWVEALEFLVIENEISRLQAKSWE